MFAKEPLSLEKCKKAYEFNYDNNDLEKLITIVNNEIVNSVVKKNLVKSNGPIVLLKFSIHFGVVKNLQIQNLTELQLLIMDLKEVFNKEGYKVSLHNQSDGTIIFSLGIPFDLEPTFV